mmetsp:Transcript_19551/g.57975  ORF Transcript_19551/g.57975 Transcript_19551/m.57975 type:complete len:124 (+) Transcript_19551:2444-2815(+)
MIVKGAGLDTRDVTTLLEKIYGKLGIDALACSRRNLLDKGILCPRNEDVALINDTAMKLFGMYLPDSPQTHTYTSADTHIELPDGEVMPSEYLNTFDTPELPPHVLNLKVGCPLMCLRISIQK